MCGNFGLLLLALQKKNDSKKKNSLKNVKLDDINASYHGVRIKTMGDELSMSSHQHSKHSSHGTNNYSLNKSNHLSKSNHSNNGLSKSNHWESSDFTTKDESMFETSRLGGFRTIIEMEDDRSHQSSDFLSPLQILEAQTSCTEIRGGQAGGYSSIEYKDNKTNVAIVDEFNVLTSNIKSTIDVTPITNRVRCVAKKRKPLALDLSNQFRLAGGKDIDPSSTLSVIGHTRFATSSVNVIEELHPHEWVPFKKDWVWIFDSSVGRYEKVFMLNGINISHNGDFESFDSFHQKMVNDELGYFLERVLHTSNDLTGDSPKIAGCMDLLRVQGHWGNAARLAWVRCVLTSNTDVTGGEPLSKSASNTFPDDKFWLEWSKFLESLWEQHMNNIIKPTIAENKGKNKYYKYNIDNNGVKQLVKSLCKALMKEKNVTTNMDLIDEPIHNTNSIDVISLRDHLGAALWTTSQMTGFMNCCVRGFLKSDLYNALNEFFARAEGSFGIQAHCSLENGVVVIGSRGQPMSMSYHPYRPLVLFASEAEALAVPIDTAGNWLPERIDLDSRGEIMRIGTPRALCEGQFFPNARKSFEDAALNSFNRLKKDERTPQRFGRVHLVSSANINKGNDSSIYLSALLLQCDVEIQSYKLDPSCTCLAVTLLDRSIPILSAPIPYDPLVDLVATDLAVIPATISTINRVWSTKNSIESRSGRVLSRRLINCMKRRLAYNLDTTDLLIGGIEVSLWIAEQFAADLRSIFPNLNVDTVSTNKLLHLGSDNPAKVFFTGSNTILPRRIDQNTCVLLISQSGQTFATLHATRKLVSMVGENLFIMTGCFNSKMEQAVSDGYKALNIPIEKMNYKIFNNYSGNRPAEPSSVATVATWHTLTRLLMSLIHTIKRLHPTGMITSLDKESKESMSSTPTTLSKKIYDRERDSSVEINDNNKTIILEENVNIDIHSSNNLLDRKSKVYKAVLRNVRQSYQITEVDNYNDIKCDIDLESNADVSSDVVVRKRLCSMDLDENDDEDEDDMIIGKKNDNSVILLSNEELDDVTGYNSDSSDEDFTFFHKKLITPIFPSIPQEKKRLCLLSDGCVADFESLLSDCVLSGLENIVGYDKNGKRINSSSNIDLINRGKAWSDHINEQWLGIIALSVYIFISVGLGLPIVGLLIGDAIIKPIMIAFGNDFDGTFGFSLRNINSNKSKTVIIISIILQILDALFYIYFGKLFIYSFRLWNGRPLWARPGKRTIVIVDTPCVHQLTESFVSKLFSQAYSFSSVDVHGASGIDHFVHRFTHRVVRGVLLAVGRPDGRLCCLAKSESAILLAVKQAAFIRNPDYNGSSSGPEIVTIGHNPFQPNMGLAHYIVLKNRNNSTSRKLFFEEYLFEKLYLASNPFTSTILRSLSQQYNNVEELILNNNQWINDYMNMPYGVHHIDPSFKNLNRSKPLLMDLYSTFKTQLFQDKNNKIDDNIKQKKHGVNIKPFSDITNLSDSPDLASPISTISGDISVEFKKSKNKPLVSLSNDPAVRMAFTSKLDSITRNIQECQGPVEQLYESRIASLERYVAFCVMFHAMASSSCKPFGRKEWDIARSQSNLRVATTASPISVGTEEQTNQLSSEAKKIVLKFVSNLKGYKVNF